MNRRLRVILIIEALIIFGLLFHMARSPHFLVMLVLSIVFSLLASRLRSGFFRVISTVLWAITVIILVTAGWFWLAIIFPIITVIVFWKNHPREMQGNPSSVFFGHQTENPETRINKNNGNDIIDLDDISFKATGNSLSIKKATGNTKIIVPDDVAVVLDVTTNTGIVKIFDEAAKINAGNIRYFSENAESMTKRIRIMIRVETGNIEVVRG
ncbi:cell wall-active antibiotics response protein LiaF [Lactococcus nasutitermitis]|uniref:Cell wall-active antibiotics response protein LiaF n=1 Tax=Lactococcus nasutitermitis TaxID=1652957 RepID=A0ABV9JEJ7_9LACT|nr:cell wall-active antibiotics response protein LiaF [Lactococcus nasutitermitis]